MRRWKKCYLRTKSLLWLLFAVIQGPFNTWLHSFRIKGSRKEGFNKTDQHNTIDSNASEYREDGRRRKRDLFHRILNAYAPIYWRRRAPCKSRPKIWNRSRGDTVAFHGCCFRVRPNVDILCPYWLELSFEDILIVDFRQENAILLSTFRQTYYSTFVFFNARINWSS